MSILRLSILGLFFFISNLNFSQEICTNGIDDDGDGLIDLNDPDCACSGILPASLIPNHSFETITCCPSTYGQLTCLGPNNIWNNAGGSPDLFNTCDWTHFMGPVGLLPFPDGNGAAGIFAATDYSERIGGCFLTPLVAGTPYTLQFSFASTGKTVNPNNGENEPCVLNFPTDTVLLELYGGPNCGTFYSGSACPNIAVPSFVFLGSAAISQNTPGYQTVTINFTPTINIAEFNLGYQCGLPAGWPSLTEIQIPGACSPYGVMDNLILNTTTSFTGVSISSQGDVCSNNLALVANAAQPGSFQWFSAGIAIAGQTRSTLDISALSLPTGMYQVLYNNATDCGIDSFFVDNSVSNSLIANSPTICIGDTAILNADGAISYSWFTMDGNVISSSDTAIVSPIAATNYFVVGTMANGCLDTVTSIVNVTTLPNDVDVTISPIPVETNATISLSNSAYAYTWLTPDSSVFNGSSLSYEFPDGDGVYDFLVSAQNADGCTFDFTVPITINSDLLIYVPNAFTPDGNEFNDIFKPIISDKMNKNSFVFKIYNRWGQVLFESRNVEIGWDGTYQSKKVPSGTYSWVIDFEIVDVDEPRQYAGHVNVLR